MAIDVIEESGSNSIILRDVVDISHAADMKRILLRTLQSNVPLKIRIEGLTAIDVTIVQLLWTAVRYASTAGKELRFDGTWSEDVARSISHSGILPLMESIRTQSLPGGGSNVLAVRH